MRVCARPQIGPIVVQDQLPGKSSTSPLDPSSDQLGGFPPGRGRALRTAARPVPREGVRPEGRPTDGRGAEGRLTEGRGADILGRTVGAMPEDGRGATARRLAAGRLDDDGLIELGRCAGLRVRGAAERVVLRTGPRTVPVERRPKFVERE